MTNWHGDTPEHEESEEEKEMMKENIIDPNGPAGLGPGWNPKNEHHGAMNGQGTGTVTTAAFPPSDNGVRCPRHSPLVCWRGVIVMPQ